METISSSSLLELIIGTFQWNNTYQQYLAVLHVTRRSVWKTNKRSSSWGWPTWRSTWRRWHGKDARLVETKRFLQTPDTQDDDVDRNEHFHNQLHLDKVGSGKRNAQKTQKFDLKGDLLFFWSKRGEGLILLIFPNNYFAIINMSIILRNNRIFGLSDATDTWPFPYSKYMAGYPA